MFQDLLHRVTRCRLSDDKRVGIKNQQHERAFGVGADPVADDDNLIVAVLVVGALELVEEAIE